jgi:hypothetical protein
MFAQQTDTVTVYLNVYYISFVIAYIWGLKGGYLKRWINCQTQITSQARSLNLLALIDSTQSPY